MRRVWIIEKAVPGRYHNSRWIWRRVGTVRAFTETSAQNRAREIVGGVNPIRVLEHSVQPLFDAPPPAPRWFGKIWRTA